MVLAALTVLLVACGGSADHVRPTGTPVSTPKPVASRAPSDDAQLDHLLLERGAAIQARDGAALARTSTGPQQARDRKAMTDAKPLSLSYVEMSSEDKRITGKTATLRTTLGYAFAGIESRFYKLSTIKAVKTPRGWRVRSDRPSDGVYAPWEVGPYVQRESSHFVALAPRGLAVGSLMTDLEKGRARMKAALPGVTPPPKLLVLVSRTDRETKALTKNVRTLSAVTAFAEAQLTFHGPARRVRAVDGQRVFIMWHGYHGESVDMRREIIAHELTHAALAKRTSGRTPAWLVEGIAMYASGDQRGREAGLLLGGGQLRDHSKQKVAEAAVSLDKLSTHDALDRMSAVPLAFAYSYASAAAFAIAGKYGRKGLLRLYLGFNNEHIRGKAGRKLSDRVVRHTLKESLSSLEAQASAFARASVS